MTKADFVEQARDHYSQKLAEEKERFGIKAIAIDFFDHNARVVVESLLFGDIAKQLGLKAYVGFPPCENQTVAVTLSESEVPHPSELIELFDIVDTLVSGDNRSEMSPMEIESLLDDLMCYDGPYFLEVPDEFDDD